MSTGSPISLVWACLSGSVLGMPMRGKQCSEQMQAGAAWATCIYSIEVKLRLMPFLLPGHC